MRIVHYDGAPIASVRTAWESARDLAYLDSSVTTHVLWHTRATWAMQAGLDRWEVAGALGMSVKVLEDVYGHHHPDWQQNIANL